MKPWTYQPSPALQQTAAEQLTVFPREPDLTHTALRLLWMCAIRGILRVYFRLRVSGLEQLPHAGSFVLVSNHTSHLDAVTLTSILPLRSVNRAYAIAAKDYFFSTFWRSLFTAICFNAIPFDRQRDKRKSLEFCADVLQASDRVLVMFPEGTRSPTGELQPFKKGIGILVAGTDRHVVPTYIDGAYAAWPKGAVMPRPKRVRLIVGQPLQFAEVPRTDEGFMLVAQRVQEAVQHLGRRAHGLL